jgi:hypothetical protein
MLAYANPLENSKARVLLLLPPREQAAYLSHPGQAFRRAAPDDLSTARFTKPLELKKRRSACCPRGARRWCSPTHPKTTAGQLAAQIAFGITRSGLVGDRGHRKGQLRVLGSPSVLHPKEPRTGWASTPCRIDFFCQGHLCTRTGWMTGAVQSACGQPRGGCFNTQARARDTPVALVAGRWLLALLASGLQNSRNLEISKSHVGKSETLAHGVRAAGRSIHCSIRRKAMRRKEM